MPDENVFDTATRIAAGDDGRNYDKVAITLHWLTALLVVVQFVLGQTWDWFSRPTRHLMVVTHMSFGIILTLVILCDCFGGSFFDTISPRLNSGPGWGWLQRRCTTPVRVACDGSRARVPVRWEGNEAMSFFGVLIPPPFTGSGQSGAPASGHSQLGWLDNHCCGGSANAARRRR